MLVDEIRTVFSEWTDKNGLSTAGIRFQESFDAPLDLHDDYRVVYEASFEPAALDKARIEFWLTDTGHVAVGVETYERVALRLGRRLARRGFAVGNEPRTETADALRKLFALVTRGKFFLEVKTILNIWNTARIYVEPSDYNTMIESGYRSSGWLSAIPNSDARPSRPLFGAILDYKPW